MLVLCIRGRKRKGDILCPEALKAPRSKINTINVLGPEIIRAIKYINKGGITYEIT